MSDGAEPGGAGSVRSLRMLFEAGAPQREDSPPSKPVPKPKPGTVKGPADSSPVEQEAERPQSKPKPEVHPKPPTGTKPDQNQQTVLGTEDGQNTVPSEATEAAENETNTEAVPTEKASSPPPSREVRPPNIPKRTDIPQSIPLGYPAEKPPAIPRRPPASTAAAPAPAQVKRDDSPRAPAAEPSATTNINLIDDTPLNEPPSAIPEPKHTQTAEKPPTERRPAPRPPAPQPAAPPARYNACFEAVCTRSANTEPKVAPATVSFVWARSKLPTAELAEVWDTVSNADPACTGLDRAQFICALALIDAKLDLAHSEKAPQAPRAPQAPPLPRRPAV